ncbi:MAG: Flp family type IVb pilin [Alphaproteobacteria bacterium]
MLASLKAFLSTEDGATAIEYGLIGAMVSVAALTALSAMGDGIAQVFEISAGSIDAVIPAGDA